MMGKLMIGVLAAAVAGGVVAQDRLRLTGAGASFPAPVYQVWSYGYTEGDLGAAVNYQSVGSGAGRNQIREGTVDFAGTDDPVSAADCEAWGLVQFPMLRGAVVPIVNLPRVPRGALRLSPETLAGLFLGEIKKWDDPRVQADNPGLKLPKGLRVTVVHRSDSSGTSAIFTSWLASVSPAWKARVGAGASVKWPCGLGGQKNPGVCNNVAKVRGAIGYTEWTYALEAGLSVVQLKDEAGTWVEPSSGSWPLMGTTYILLRKDTPAEKLAALKAYFRWCLTEGLGQARELHYTPLPEAEREALLKGVLGE